MPLLKNNTAAQSSAIVFLMPQIDDTLRASVRAKLIVDSVLINSLSYKFFQKCRRNIVLNWAQQHYELITLTGASFDLLPEQYLPYVGP